MHITALCPFCRSAYQVQETLRGKLIRCPNAACHKVFPVPGPEKEPPPAPSPSPKPTPAPGNGPRSGTVGDMVPMLPAEQAAPPQEPSIASKHVYEMLPAIPVVSATAGKPAEADWSQVAPPVRGAPARSPARPAPTPSSEQPPAEERWWSEAPATRSPQTPVQPVSGPTQAAPTQRLRAPDRPPAQTQQMAALSPAPSPPSVGEAEGEGQPREIPPGAWEPPPVRRGQAPQEQAAPPTEETAESEHPQPRISKRLAKRLMAGAILLTALILGGASLWVWSIFRYNEDTISKRARGYYDQDSFRNAAEDYILLVQKFPNSEHAAEYSFMADWSAVCRDVSAPDADMAAAATQLDEFVKKNKKDPLMEKCAHAAGQRLLSLVKRFVDHNANSPDEGSLPVADLIERVRRTVMSLGSNALTKKEFAQIDADLANVRRAVELARKRREVLAQLKKRDNETPMEAIKRARSLLARMERELPDLHIGQDAEAKAALAQLYDIHRLSVAYHPAAEAPPPLPPPAVDEGQVMLFAPLLPVAAPGNAPPNDPIVLAVIRGVLYALKQSNGELKWATHVGPDTTVLPQRVPISAASPELILVLSADTQTLTALGVEGDPLWEYRIGQPVLGRPIIIDHRAYLADYSGWVHEIELSQGQPLGRWYLGQPLTSGGARESDTSRIYFPADDSCIYVLDVNPKTRGCVAILEDGHPSGSLRSEPIVIPPEGENAPGYLILNQASGLDTMRLRVFELPILDRHASPLPLDPPARLDGWTWFAPKEDGEKLAVLSDAGILGLFGIRQRGNNDPALFPLLQPGGLNLSPFLQTRRELSRERGRSQVIHMQGDDLWILAHGRFQQVQLRWKFDKGPEAASVWKTPLTLGSPLHEPQRVEDRDGRSTFFLVTQALEQQTCLATAVEQDSKIKWQRQLGLVCQGEPLALTPPHGGPPLLVALDQGGGLFVLDPQQPLDKLRFIRRALAPALAENPSVPPMLLPAADGHSAYEIAAPGDGRSLIVRHVVWDGDERKLSVQESPPVPLEGLAGAGVLAPAGGPAITDKQLFIPMNDGNIMALSLVEEKPQLQAGPSWRDEKRPPVLAPCLLALGGDRFLSTDANRRLTVYEWPPEKNKNWQQLSKDDDPAMSLDSLMAAPPVLLPPENGQPRIAVADSAGILHVFTVTPKSSLFPGLKWELKGNLTAGPFVYASPEGGCRIGCVLDRRRLHWLDPTKEEPLWTYSSKGPAILGQPQRIEDMLVVSLQSGCYVGINPNTGELMGEGYTLRTSAAPAATPMPFGRRRMFAPLSDGTALLLSLDLLKGANHRVTENTEKKKK